MFLCHDDVVVQEAQLSQRDRDASCHWIFC